VEGRRRAWKLLTCRLSRIGVRMAPCSTRRSRTSTKPALHARSMAVIRSRNDGLSMMSTAENGHTSQRPPGERQTTGRARRGGGSTQRPCDREAGRRTRAVLGEVVDGAHVALASGKVKQRDAPAEAEGEVRVVLLVQVPEGRPEKVR